MELVALMVSENYFWSTVFLWTAFSVPICVLAMNLIDAIIREDSPHKGIASLVSIVIVLIAAIASFSLLSRNFIECEDTKQEIVHDNVVRDMNVIMCRSRSNISDDFSEWTIQ